MAMTISGKRPDQTAVPGASPWIIGWTAGRFTRGLFFPEEAHLDPRAALVSLEARLAALGVALLRHSCWGPERELAGADVFLQQLVHCPDSPAAVWRPVVCRIWVSCLGGFS